MSSKHDRYRIELPPLVRRAMAFAETIDFPTMPEGQPVGYTGPPTACIPQVGALLATLVASRPGGRFAEHGTGAGVGTAWITSAMSNDSRLVTAEIDPDLAAAATELFQEYPNVEVRAGDCGEVLAGEPPFDLLFMDADARQFLDRDSWDRTTEFVRVGGLIVFDDLQPIELWPPEWDDMIDQKREFAFRNLRVVGAEVRTTATEAALVITRVR